MTQLGLGALKKVQKINEPWIGLMDFTITKGAVKTLVVLASKLSKVAKNRAMQVSDLDCIGVQPMTQTKGEQIKKHLVKLFKKTENPSAVIKDKVAVSDWGVISGRSINGMALDGKNILYLSCIYRSTTNGS
jgi:hypothetical protein